MSPPTIEPEGAWSTSLPPSRYPAVRLPASLLPGLVPQLLAGVDGNLDSAVLLPARFGIVGGHRLLFTQSASAYPGAAHTLGDEIFRRRIRPAHRQALVVLGGADAVGVTQNEQIGVGYLSRLFASSRRLFFDSAFTASESKS